MHTQTYYHTKFEADANRESTTVSLQVNCTGAVSQMRFANRSVRLDFYYIYVLKGKMILEDCELLAGDVIVLEPGHPYQYESEGETEYLWVHYTGFDARSITVSALQQLNVKKTIGIHPEIADCFEKLFRGFIINDEASKTLSVCLVKEILALTSRYAGERSEKTRPFASIEYIHRFFRTEIDVDSLAAMENKSPTAFRSAFKAHTGVSPNEYIILQRISEACSLLSRTDKNISEIAKAVGYEDPYYFSRIFKKKVGMSPFRYRQNAEEGRSMRLTQ